MSKLVMKNFGIPSARVGYFRNTTITSQFGSQPAVVVGLYPHVDGKDGPRCEAVFTRGVDMRAIAENISIGDEVQIDNGALYESTYEKDGETRTSNSIYKCTMTLRSKCKSSVQL